MSALLLLTFLLLPGPRVLAGPAEPPLADLESAYLRGEYGRVVQLSQERAGQASLAPHLDRLWYLAGMAHLQLQQPIEAEQAFQQVLAGPSEGSWRMEAGIGLGDAALMSGDPRRALKQYQAILSQPGSDRARTRARFQLAQAGRQAGEWATARQALEAVVRQEPDSFEAALARQILEQDDFAFAIQAGAFGLRENAVRLQRQLVARGYEARVDRTLADGRVMHRVRIGRFATREEAAQAAARLKDEGFPAKVVP